MADPHKLDLMAENSSLKVKLAKSERNLRDSEERLAIAQVCHFTYPTVPVVCYSKEHLKVNTGVFSSGAQPHFQSWGPIPWSLVLLPFYTETFDRSIQFGAVGYIITLYSSKSYVKSWGSVQIFGRSGPPDPQWLRPCFSSSPLCTLLLELGPLYSTYEVWGNAKVNIGTL